MKRAICLLISMLLSFYIIPVSSADDFEETIPIGVASNTSFVSDCYYITETSIKASSFSLTPSLTISSPSSNKVSVLASAHTNVIVDTIGFTSLIIQRWNGSSWVDAVSWTNRFKSNTLSFSFTGSTSSATSGAYYRAVCTFYAEKNGETESVTVTTSYIKCK